MQFRTGDITWIAERPNPLLDKTAYEQIQIKNAIDQRAQAENAINKASQDAIQLTEKQKQAYFDLYQSYADQLNEVEAKKREISRDPYAQASISLKNYADSSTNLGAQIGNSLTSAFSKAESAATKFFETGKFNARAFGQELINMMIQVSTQQMFGNIMKLAAGGGSGMAGMMGGLFGGSGQVDPASYVTNPTSAGSFSGDAFFCLDIKLNGKLFRIVDRQERVSRCVTEGFKLKAL